MYIVVTNISGILSSQVPLQLFVDSHFDKCFMSLTVSRQKVILGFDKFLTILKLFIHQKIKQNITDRLIHEKSDC